MTHKKQGTRQQLLRLVYFFCVICIAGASLFIYGAWWKRYIERRPNVTVAKPHVHSDLIPVETALLWREQVVRTPYAGNVRYPRGQGPFYASAKESVAVVSASNGKTYALQVESPGYFVAALDGLEGKWDYSLLWQGASSFPKAPPLKFIPGSAMIGKGEAVGKMIYQPQQLRAVAYLQSVPGLEDEIDDHRIAFKNDENSLPFEAEIRAVRPLGPMVKMYLTLPFFPESRVISRKATYLLYLGEKKGVVLPESAVVTREGKLWTYVVRGDLSDAREIRGFPLQKGQFLVTSGLEPGETVLTDGAKGKEGVVRLW